MVLSENRQVTALLFSSIGFFAASGSSKQKIARLKIRTNHTQNRCSQLEKPEKYEIYKINIDSNHFGFLSK